jgi:hypothetical protein
MYIQRVGFPFALGYVCLDTQKFRASLPRGTCFRSVRPFLSLLLDCKIPRSVHLSLVESLLLCLSQARYEVESQSRLYSQTIDGQVQSTGFQF